jgi:redox-sensitive bicupin YhaK (pirin superfamily)
MLTHLLSMFKSFDEHDTRVGTSSSWQIGRSEERGHTKIGCLDSRHTFSFGSYHDPAHVGFGPLGVINDDLIAPTHGFPMHPHRNMEIISWVTAGELTHHDSTGGEGTIRPGGAQVMSAGRGIRHSEFNPSQAETTRLLQIWIEPRESGLPPRYDQKHWSASSLHNQFQLIAGPDSDGDHLPIAQNVRLWIARLSSGQMLSLPTNNAGWLQVATGQARVGTEILHAGDALSREESGPDSVTTLAQSKILLFDLF